MQQGHQRARGVSPATALTAASPVAAAALSRSPVVSPSPKMASLLTKAAPMVLKGVRNASTQRKVCVIGAAGGIGQPLGLLMKMVRPRCACAPCTLQAAPPPPACARQGAAGAHAGRGG